MDEREREREGEREKERVNAIYMLRVVRELSLVGRAGWAACFLLISFCTTRPKVPSLCFAFLEYLTFFFFFFFFL